MAQPRARRDSIIALAEQQANLASLLTGYASTRPNTANNHTIPDTHGQYP